MKMRGTWLALLAVAAIGFIAESASAETISIKGHSKKEVKDGCGAGGHFFPPSKYGVYGCLNGDGSGIVCGGTGKDAKTCDTFKKAPPSLPTRQDIRKAEKAEVTPGGEKK